MNREDFKNILPWHINLVKGYIKDGKCGGLCFTESCPFNSDHSESDQHIAVCGGELYDNGLDKNLVKISHEFLRLFDIIKIDLTE